MIETQIMFAVWCIICLIIGYRLGYKFGVNVGVKYTTHTLTETMLKLISKEQTSDILYHNAVDNSNMNEQQRKALDHAYRQVKMYINKTGDKDGNTNYREKN